MDEDCPSSVGGCVGESGCVLMFPYSIGQFYILLREQPGLQKTGVIDCQGKYATCFGYDGQSIGRYECGGQSIGIYIMLVENSTNVNKM